MAIQEQLFRIQPAELVAYSGIVNWENLAAWIKSKVPECAVSVYQEEEGAPQYFAQHFGSDDVADTLVHDTVDIYCVICM